MSRFHTSQSTLTRTVIAALVSLAGASAALGQAEAEPNNSIAQANVLSSTNTTVTGTFINSVDLDFFKITLTEYTALSLHVWGPTPGVCPGGGFDPVVYLYNSSGVQIAFNDDTNSLCARLDAGNAPVMGALPPGVYYVRVDQLQNLLNQPYSLVIASVPAPTPIKEIYTYQGRLNAAGSPFTGDKTMRFALWSHPTSTAPNAKATTTIEQSNIAVNAGLFAVDLDFTGAGHPSEIDGTERYLEIEVADSEGSETFTTLSPRQRLSPAPHAIHALRAGVAARAGEADFATTAGFANEAQSANTANSATTASSANSVSWTGITGKPSEFADNDDGTGGWIESSAVTYTTLDVGINTNNPGAFALAVSGTAAKTGGGTWAVFCDERLKHDIKPMTGTLDRLLQLRGYTYEYNAEAVGSRLALPGTQIGLMAQEVERVFPDWVGLDKQGFRYVTERSTTALMVEALRDLRAEKDAQIETLKKEAAARDAQNAELKARLDAIEAMLKTGRADEKPAR